MAFGYEYSFPSSGVRFTTVSSKELTDFSPGTDAVRYLSSGLQKLVENPDSLYEYMAGPATRSWSIKIGESMAGFAIIHTATETPWLRTLVGEEFQGRGLGKLAHCMRLHDWFLDPNHAALRSYVYPGNDRSMQNVQSRGFYHFVSAKDDMSPYNGYQAVNPVVWEAFHEEHPSVNATDEMRQRVENSLAFVASLQPVA